jgi:hypothetical protein
MGSEGQGFGGHTFIQWWAVASARRALAGLCRDRWRRTGFLYLLDKERSC